MKRNIAGRISLVAACLSLGAVLAGCDAAAVQDCILRGIAAAAAAT